METKNNTTIVFLNSMNQVSNAINALLNYQPPLILPQPIVKSFNSSKEVTFDSWFVNVLDQGALGPINAMQEFYKLNIREKDTYLKASSTFIPAITNFQTSLSSLKVIEDSILNIESKMIANDEKQLAALTAKVQQIESQIQNLSEEIQESAFKIGATIIITLIKVGIKVATEQQPGTDLICGVIKVSESIASDIELTQEIENLTLQLESIWQSLDENDQQLATLKFSLNQLSNVLNNENVAQSLHTAIAEWTHFENNIKKENWNAVGNFINRFSTISNVQNAKLFLT